MDDWTQALDADGEAVRVRVRVTPRASNPGLDGLADDGTGRRALRVRLAAPPAEGRANTEAAERLAGWLGVRRADVVLLTGATARTKVFRVAGLSVADAASRLAAGARPGG